MSPQTKDKGMPDRIIGKYREIRSPAADIE